MKVMQKSSLAGRQSQNLEIGDNNKHYRLNWRNNADITSFYFTHFPDEANEELLWRHFKNWGDVREVYIAKRLNKDGRRYGFMRFKGVSDAKGLEVRLDNIFINDCKLFVNLPRFDRPVRNTELQKKNPIRRKYTDEASKPCGVTTGALRRSYVDVVTKGGCQGDKRTDEAQTPTILINPDEGGEYWCNETWVGMLKKVMEVETLEDRITWELGYNVRTKFLGDDMVLLPGMSDDKAQLLIQSETESDDSLFYSLEKWTPKCRPNNRVVWLQLWGFPIQVWEMKNLRRAVAAIGDVIESDDDTEDRRRLDRARVLVRTPLPPLIRSEVIVRVGELEYRVWIVEETGFEGGSNRKGSSPSDGWSEMITSDDGGEVGDVLDDTNTNFSFSSELPNQKLSPSRTQRAEGGTDVRCCDLRPLGNIQADVTPKEKSKGTVEGMLGSSFGKLNLGDSFAGTEEEAANTKEVTCYNTLQDDQRHRNHIEGKYLNGGAKVAADQTFIGEEEGHVTQSLSPSLSGQIQQGIGPGCIKGPISTQGGCNKEDIHPVELLGVQAVQNQKEGGLSNDLGPILKTDGCHKEESLPVIQSIKETPDKYSKVYFRQQNSLFKARLSQIEEKHPQLQDGIQALADQLANQDKVKNQSYVDSERRLKSIIECSDKVLQEAQQLWHLGENLGMETVTDNLHFLHSYASMECRDRKEAKELGNRKPLK